MRIVAAFLFVLCISPATAQTAHLAGHVVTPDGKPIPRAMVRLTGTGGGRGTSPKTYIEATGRDGSFAVESIDAGKYIAGADAPGFMSSDQNGRPEPITIAPGERRKDVQIVLTPLGIVSGVALDDAGDPVQNAQVSLLRPTFNRGRMRMEGAFASAATDDRGQFRLHDIEPGRYYLRAASEMRFDGGGRPNEIRGVSTLEAPLPTYYPSSADLRGATRLTVTSAPTENLQLHMQRGKTYSISGVVEGITATLGAYMSLQTDEGGGTGVQVRPDGKFEAVGVVPGEYTLTIQQQIPGGDVPNPLNRNAARAHVSVVAADVKNVVLRFAANFDLRGRIRAEDVSDWKKFIAQAPARPAAPAIQAALAAGGDVFSADGLPEGVSPEDLQEFFVQMSVQMSAGPGPQGPSLMLQPAEEWGQPRRIPINDDGTFTTKGFAPGTYVIYLAGLPRGTFVKSVSQGSHDMTRQVLELSASGDLELTVSTKSGSLKMQVPAKLPESRDPEDSTAIMIWPAVADASRADGGVIQSAIRRGQPNTVNSIPPGDYYVAAFEDQRNPEVEAIPEFLARLNAQAKRVTIHEGENTVEPAVISHETLAKAVEEFP